MDRSDDLLVALRKVIRAIDLHSKKLAQQHGLTGPQALILKELIKQGPVPMGALAKAVSLSNATVSDITTRLEKKGYLIRTRAEKDRRQIMISATTAAKKTMARSIPLLQEQFIRRFKTLEEWERTQLVSSLERISFMMDADNIDASPILAIAAPDTPPETIADESGTT